MIQDKEHIVIENESSSSESDAEYPRQSTLSILSSSDDIIKVNENFLIELSKNNNKLANREVKESCKLISFSSELTADDILVAIDKLDSRQYPNLFIFIIHAESIQFSKIKKRKKDRRNKLANFFKELVLKFSKSRSLILQLTSKIEKITKFYYKTANATQFSTIDQHQKDFDKLRNFPTFLSSFLEKKNQSFDYEIIEKLSNVQELPLTLKFIRIFNLSEKFWLKIISEVSKNGSKAQLLAALDASFKDEGRILTIESESYLSSTFNEFQAANEQLSEINHFQQESEKINLSSQSLIDGEPIDNPFETSILHKALENNNKEIIEYLVSHCTHLIQQLPYRQQLKISTEAFSTNKLDILCDLVEICDFPFPDNYNFDDGTVVDEKLRKITKNRIEFQRAIILGDYEQIDEFLDNNSSLRIVYNPVNDSAMYHAVKKLQFPVYFYLKSFGFVATEFNSLQDILNESELAAAKKSAGQQRKRNVSNSLSDDQKSINLLYTKSFIHNRKISKEQEIEYRKKIRKWYEDIHNVKFGAEVLKVVASCEELKVIFDFESFSVENASLSGPHYLGSTYSNRKWIFIGAKLSDKKREQQIKGVLAHELCHFSMGIAFENHDNPYYKHMTNKAEIFEAIVKIFNQRSPNVPDDECNGTILSVFQLYDKVDYHIELVVRMLHILVEYDDDEEKSKHLQDKYKMLYVFWELHIIPELESFDLKGREAVRRINRIFDILPSIKAEKLKFTASKDIPEVINNQFVIATSNVPKLLLINICRNLESKYGNLFDTQNIFIDLKKLKNQEMLRNLVQIVSEHPKLRTFIDCTKGGSENIRNIEMTKELTMIFVVSSATQRDEILHSMKNNQKNATKLEINYKWCDLTEESQKYLLETKVNFQNDKQYSLNDILDRRSNVNNNFEDIIDCQLLNLLVNKSDIPINMIPKSSGTDINFNCLFQTRQFNDKSSTKIIQDRLLKEVKNKKYVLISDIAGSGKSWIMKNFANVLRKQNPKTWVTYVDLKLYIEDFRASKCNTTFLDFFTEKIFKTKNKFEVKIFLNLYKSGKVNILFDGFDEIAPNYADFVLQLAEYFESNGTNQLWIATREYFKIDILKKLKIDAVYKLDEFTKENGINLVVSSWILMDLKGTKDFKSREEFENYSKNLPNYKIYEQKARLIVQKVAMDEKHSVGLPQLFKMIAEGYHDDKDTTFNLQGYKIYAKFVHNLYKRWSEKKGLLRNEASIKSIEFEVSFWQFHQYFAVKKLFHEFVKALFPNYDGSEWIVTETIACGLMSKRGKTFYFVHETFRDFFASDLIAKALKKLNITEKSTISKFFGKKEQHDYIIEIVVIVLTTKEYGTILMFLDDAIDDYSNLEKIQSSVQKSIKKFYEMENFCEFFTKNLKMLTTFLIAILKTGDYAEVKKLVTENARKIIENTEDSKSFFKFQEFIFMFLKVDDFKDLVKNEGIIQAILTSRLSIEAFKDFVIKAERVTDHKFIKDTLELSNVKSMDGNIFHKLSCSVKIDGHKVQIFLKIIQKFFKMPKILELVKKFNDQDQNIFKVCVKAKNTENLKILWTELQNFFILNNTPQYFKEIINQEDSTGCNILHWTANCDQIEFHETLWNLLLTTFEDREELKDFVVHRNKSGDNSFHKLVMNQNNLEIIELTMDIYKKNFNDAQLQDILKSVGHLELNLLHSAAYESNVISQQQFLWKIYQNFYKSDQEFLKTLEEVDTFGRNILNIAAENSSNEVFEFIMQEIEKIAPLDTIKNMLKAQILEFIKHLDKDGDDILFIAVGSNTRKILELTWIEIKSIVDPVEHVEYLKMKAYNGKNLLKKSIDNQKYKKEVHEWVQKLMHEYLPYFKEIVRQNDLDILDILYWTADSDKIEFHTTLWDVLFKKFENREELKNFVIQKNILGDTFVHRLIHNNKNAIIKLTFETFKTNFGNDQFRAILEAKGRLGMTLLQTAVYESNVVGFHQILWRIFRDYYNSKEFLEIIKEVDMRKRNIFNISAAHSSIGLFHFYIRELQRISPIDVIREMLKNLDDNNRNVLQSAAMRNASLELHSFLWRVLRQFFEPSEIIWFIKHVDKYGNNILFLAVIENTKKVAQLTWKEIKSYLNKTEQVEYLKIKGWKGKDLIESALDNFYETKIHEWVQNLMLSVISQDANVKDNDVDDEYLEDDESSYY
ncbi:unnamed protein product [Chironomus riparius]|uniref:NACHT domain-containing protein n=1 Tax=Chironomus riparius TaxID=315576 RepID=A0A9N9RLX3_9DIPT|nr:unnamed protein product [Chironomus riparius]